MICPFKRAVTMIGQVPGGVAAVTFHLHVVVPQNADRGLRSKSVVRPEW